jgi:hypothetical protein
LSAGVATCQQSGAAMRQNLVTLIFIRADSTVYDELPTVAQPLLYIGQRVIPARFE